jgi:tRNA-specific 2-thiouridylase
MRVVVAMSGGVDSSVAAVLMRKAGHDVVGISLQLWDHSGTDENRFGSCCSPDDLYDARRVAEQLDMPFYVINAQADFRKHVVDGFTQSYLRGETPSPCVNCNDYVKFDRLLEITEKLGGDRLVTGHYARTRVHPDGRVSLHRAADRAKDQTYFLFSLRQDRLSRVLFPLGDMTKDEVRELAMANGLPTASKHDSQELCFVPDNDYGAFLEGEGATPVPGEIVDLEGRVRGIHRGLYRYTIGQRRGLGIASPEPLYVIGMDLERNRLLVGPDSSLFRHGLIARDVSWIREEPQVDDDVQGRIRYRSRDSSLRLTRLGDGRYLVYFAEPQRAITPGQAVVFYSGDQVLGGGWIERPTQDDFAGVQELQV